MSMSVPPADYDLLGGHFDLTSEFKPGPPPYLPEPLLPGYKLKHHMPHLRAFDSELPHSAGPEDAMLPGFDLAESIWSQGSDLTLDDLALESDSASIRTRSSASTHWSAVPPTPSTSHHSELPPAPEPAPTPAPASAPGFAAAPEPAPLRVETPAQRPESTEPESPAPPYSRDPLEFDPTLLASLDPQLRFHPFDALEDLCWASFFEPSPLGASAQPPRPRSASLSLHHPSTPSASLAAQSSLSDTSMASIPAPPVPALPRLHPTYATSKPLPDIPPPSPQPLMERTQRERRSPPHPPVVMTFESFNPLRDPSFPTAPPSDPVQFFPIQASLRTRSKSVGGTKPARIKNFSPYPIGFDHHHRLPSYDTPLTSSPPPH
ncbi:hypothetical protein BJV78DRAFT_1152183 [Lactifluus subvellereus]|nr:hypothetical protein BJV78DRAFT_1152183 [Lactifluus subvellereus]